MITRYQALWIFGIVLELVMVGEYEDTGEQRGVWQGLRLGLALG